MVVVQQRADLRNMEVVLRLLDRRLAQTEDVIHACKYQQARLKAEAARQVWQLVKAQGRREEDDWEVWRVYRSRLKKLSYKTPCCSCKLCLRQNESPKE